IGIAPGRVHGAFHAARKALTRLVGRNEQAFTMGCGSAHRTFRHGQRDGATAGLIKLSSNLNLIWRTRRPPLPILIAHRSSRHPAISGAHTSGVGLSRLPPWGARQRHSTGALIKMLAVAMIFQR